MDCPTVTVYFHKHSSQTPTIALFRPHLFEFGSFLLELPAIFRGPLLDVGTVLIGFLEFLSYFLLKVNTLSGDTVYCAPFYTFSKIKYQLHLIIILAGYRRTKIN